MIRTRGAAAALLTVALAALGLVVLATPAQAAAPVTTPDSVSMYAGNAVEVHPLLNDTDADGDDLAVCRMADSTYKKVEIFFGFTEGGEQSDETLFINARAGAKPGTYTFTYYACDFQTLVPGTITLTIDEEPNITVKALPAKPGKIKVKNPADFKIRFFYGSFKEQEPDGEIVIPQGSSVILEVQRTQIDWIAIKARGFQFLKQGRLKGITLPPGTTPPAAGRSGQTFTRMWGAVV
jgi:hypothetical protein